MRNIYTEKIKLKQIYSQLATWIKNLCLILKNLVNLGCARSPQVSIAQRDLLLTAIRACAADGELHEQEKAQIRKMASIIGVSEEIVEQLEELQKEELALREKRIKLLYPERSPY